MYRKLYFGILITFFIFAFFAMPLFAATGKDPCGEEGLIVKNLTLVNLWYKKNSSDCIMWRRDHIIAIKPEDTIEIFSDLVCKTPYCAGPPTYADYKSLDTDGDCRVRILPDCNISDM
jgi:hypothetical protein